MDAAPSSAGIAAVSSPPPSEWPSATQWVPPPADRSIRLSTEPAPSWPRSAQLTAALFLVVAVGLLGWHVYIAGRWNCRPTVLEVGTLDSPSIDLNKADHEQLVQLPGVSDKLARRIETYRAEHQGFRDVEELREVSGIGPKTLEKLRPHVRVEAGKRGSEESPPLRTRSKKPALTRPIDINRASAAELRALPRIGPVLSQRILEARAKKPFRSVDDLRRVRGIGPKTLDQLRPYVVVEE